MPKSILVTLVIVLCGLLFAIGSVVITEGSELLANLASYIMGLFGCADLIPASQGFSCFIQLVAIAIFVGWSIHRFKSSRKR